MHTWTETFSPLLTIGIILQIHALVFRQGLNFDEKNDDFSDLPPNQRRKKIVAKIDSIQSQINQELAVR